MTHHWDYSGKTKSERRERGEEKRRERMNQGKGVKLLQAIVMERAAKAEREYQERKRKRAERRRKKGARAKA